MAQPAQKPGVRRGPALTPAPTSLISRRTCSQSLNPVANKKVWSLAALLVVLGGAAAHAQGESEAFADIAAGPVFDKFGLTLDSGTGTEAAGPFYYHREAVDQSQWGIPPFYTQIRQPDVDAFTFDALPPFLVYHRHGSETTLLITPLLNVFGGQYQGGVHYRRGMLFPFYFRQVCSDPARNYLAVFPFYGTIKGRFQRGEIHFVLFPLYSRTHKRDVVTDNYLFPFVHTRTGNGLTGWQFWPLAGAEHKTLTSHTNLLGAVEPVGGHHKLFVLWPIYFNEKTGLGTDHPQEYHAVWPFYTSTTSPRRTSTGVSPAEDFTTRNSIGSPWQSQPGMNGARNPAIERDFTTKSLRILFSAVPI